VISDQGFDMVLGSRTLGNAEKGLKIKEVPVDYRNRIGTSKISGTISGAK
jgi:hypothetical protein